MTCMIAMIVYALFFISKAENPFPGENWRTGYIQVKSGASLYYYLFKARSKNIQPPALVIWLQGGPGASSSLGVFSGSGPYIVNNKTKMLEPNPYAWNNNADTLFVDQPVGVKFSFANDQSSMCKNEGCVADDFYTFLLGFYSRYPEYKKRSL